MTSFDVLYVLSKSRSDLVLKSQLSSKLLSRIVVVSVSCLGAVRNENASLNPIRRHDCVVIVAS